VPGTDVRSYSLSLVGEAVFAGERCFYCTSGHSSVLFILGVVYCACAAAGSKWNHVGYIEEAPGDIALYVGVIRLISGTVSAKDCGVTAPKCSFSRANVCRIMQPKGLAASGDDAGWCPRLSGLTQCESRLATVRGTCVPFRATCRRGWHGLLGVLSGVGWDGEA
jgi:hypothetical protein